VKECVSDIEQGDGLCDLLSLHSGFTLLNG